MGRRCGEIAAGPAQVVATVAAGLEDPDRHAAVRRAMVDDLFYNPDGGRGRDGLGSKPNRSPMSFFARLRAVRRRLAPMARPHRRWLITGTLGTLVVVACRLAFPRPARRWSSRSTSPRARC